MTFERDIEEVFRAPLIAKEEAFGATFHLFSNNIFYVVLPSYEKVDGRIVEYGYSFLGKYGTGSFRNIYHFGSFTDFEEGMREWAADPNGNKLTISDAVIIKNQGQQIMTDFYLKHNQPVKPTAIFFSVEGAIEWSLNQTEG